MPIEHVFYILVRMIDAFSRLDLASRHVSGVRRHSDASTLRGIGVSGGTAALPAVLSVSDLAGRLTDDALVQFSWQLGELRRSVDALLAIALAELSERGVAGGASIAGVDGVDAARLERVGSMIAESELAVDAFAEAEAGERGVVVDFPWWHRLAVAVAEGAIGPASALALREGLGEPDARVPEERLARAVDEAMDAADLRDPARARATGVVVRRRLEGQEPLWSSAP